MGTVVLVVALALFALQARPDLGSNTDAVSVFAAGHLVASFDDMANDLVTDTDGQRNFTPASVDAVDVRAANAAALDLNVKIVGAELLGFEL